MATATTARSPGRHPWLDAFLADPASELDNLLSGHARIEPYENADAPDAARLLFGGLAEEDEARGVLDRALREWLESQRAGGVPDLDRLPLERWIRKVSEAFEFVSLLKLQWCARDLRQRFVVWNSWTDRLNISAQRDGRYAFFRTLALTQRMVADVEPSANPFALEPLWLRICEQAGSTFASHYLAVGLLGLRMLPESEDAPSERPWMAGLGLWAIGQTPSISDFSQQWWSLKGLYPRMPSYWRNAVTETLRLSSTKRIPGELKDWWRQDVKARDGTTTQHPRMQRGGVPKLSPHSTVQSLKRKAGNPLPSIRNPIETLIDERRYYAEVTGDSHYVVTTACNIGMAVIEGADDPVGRGRFGVDLARQALAWQPSNVYGWALWRDALAKQGAFEAAELVGWEAIRRFPENVQWRNQLAELLIMLDRPDEAAGVVDEIFSRHLEDKASVDLRARLLFHSGDVETAKRVLRLGVKRFPTDSILRAHLQKLERGKQLPLKATAYGTDAAAPATPVDPAVATEDAVGTAVRQRGRLRRLFSEYVPVRQRNNEWRNAALDEVQSVLSEDPNLDYATYLNRELEGAGGDGSVRGSFAIGFIDAVKRKDADELDRLDNASSSQARLVDVAKAYFGDRPAADRALAWLKQEPRTEPRSNSALRTFLLLRLDHPRVDISTIVSGDDFVKLIADNDNVQTDLIESALAGDEMLLAA